MLGFTIPLLGFCGLLGVLGLSLILPLPFARPTIYLCKLTQTQAGISVMTTMSVILACLLAAPLYDLATLHARPEDTAGANSQRRSTEASSHLGAILTGYDLVAMFVVRKLGLALGELDNVVSGTKSVDEVKASVTAFGNTPTNKKL